MTGTSRGLLLTAVLFGLGVTTTGCGTTMYMREGNPSLDFYDKEVRKVLIFPLNTGEDVEGIETIRVIVQQAVVDHLRGQSKRWAPPQSLFQAYYNWASKQGLAVTEIERISTYANSTEGFDAKIEGMIARSYPLENRKDWVILARFELSDVRQNEVVASHLFKVTGKGLEDAAKILGEYLVRFLSQSSFEYDPEHLERRTGDTKVNG